MARTWQGQNLGVSWLEGWGRSLDFSPNSCIPQVEQGCPRLRQSEVTRSLCSWRKGHTVAMAGWPGTWPWCGTAQAPSPPHCASVSSPATPREHKASIFLLKLPAMGLRCDHRQRVVPVHCESSFVCKGLLGDPNQLIQLSPPCPSH